MGYKHTKDDLLDGAVAVAYLDGLGRLTFGRVAKHLGISDRTLVYYFPTKGDLIAEVLAHIGDDLQAALAPAFDRPAADHRELAQRIYPLLSGPEVAPTMALFFEGVGLAAGGQAPFTDAMPFLIEAWVAWAADYVDLPEKQAREEAAAAVALVDGLLLIGQTVGREAAAAAAHRLGLA